jgi:hypothetical protein
MNQTIGRRLILPVFDTFDGSAYHIVGFTAFVVTTTQFDGTQPAGNWQAESPLCSPNCKVIHGYFTDYNLPASYGSAGGGTGQDFGVRAIGLTS